MNINQGCLNTPLLSDLRRLKDLDPNRASILIQRIRMARVTDTPYHMDHWSSAIRPLKSIKSYGSVLDTLSELRLIIKDIDTPPGPPVNKLLLELQYVEIANLVHPSGLAGRDPEDRKRIRRFAKALARVTSTFPMELQPAFCHLRMLIFGWVRILREHLLYQPNHIVIPLEFFQTQHLRYFELIRTAVKTVTDLINRVQNDAAGNKW